MSISPSVRRWSSVGGEYRGFDGGGNGLGGGGGGFGGGVNGCPLVSFLVVIFCRVDRTFVANADFSFEWMNG